MATHHMAERRARLKAVTGLYRREAPFGKRVCTYCGDPCDGWDHVAPVSYVSALLDVMPRGQLAAILDRVLLIVPCCGSCNSILQDFVPTSLDEKRAELAERLRAKNWRLLAAEDWDEYELNDLERGLRDWLGGLQARRTWIRERLKFARWGVMAGA